MFHKCNKCPIWISICIGRAWCWKNEYAFKQHTESCYMPIISSQQHSNQSTLRCNAPYHNTKPRHAKMYGSTTDQYHLAKHTVRHISGDGERYSREETKKKKELPFYLSWLLVGGKKAFYALNTFRSCEKIMYAIWPIAI